MILVWMGVSSGESQKRQAAQLIPGSTLHIGDALGSGGGVTAAAVSVCILLLFRLVPSRGATSCERASTKNELS